MERCLLLCFLCLSACAQVSNPPLYLSLHATHQLNHAANEAPLPLQVSIIGVSNLDAFNRLSRDEAMMTASHHWPSSLSLKNTVLIAPDEKREIAIPLSEGDTYLAVIANFHHRQTSGWKALLTVPNAFERTFFTTPVRLTSNQVVLP